MGMNRSQQGLCMDNEQWPRQEKAGWLGGGQYGWWTVTKVHIHPLHLAFLPPEGRCPTHPGNKVGWGLFQLLRSYFYHQKEMGLRIPLKISYRTIQKAQFVD